MKSWECWDIARKAQQLPGLRTAVAQSPACQKEEVKKCVSKDYTGGKCNGLCLISQRKANECHVVVILVLGSLRQQDC